MKFLEALEPLLKAVEEYAECDTDDKELAKKTEEDLHKAAIEYAKWGRFNKPPVLKEMEQ